MNDTAINAAIDYIHELFQSDFALPVSEVGKLIENIISGSVYQEATRKKMGEEQAMIIVSECLTGVNCRMDGGNKLIPEIKALVDAGEAVPVCPEVLGGLPTPRHPSELRDGRVVNSAGEDVTAAFVRGAERAMGICREHRCTAAIMKAKSPSCGCGLIHNGRFDGGLVPGNGVFTQMLLDAGIPVMTEQEYSLSIK